MNDRGHESQSQWIQSVVERHEGPLVRYAAKITGDVERGRDAVQATFLKLWSEPNWLELDGHVAEWLFTVCRRQALDVRRKESRMNLMSDTEAAGCPSRDPSPDEQCQKQESFDRVLHALGDLPENQREVLRLKFQNGFSYKQISGITNLSVTNVGYLIHVGLKNLRERLSRPQLAQES